MRKIRSPAGRDQEPRTARKGVQFMGSALASFAMSAFALGGATSHSGRGGDPAAGHCARTRSDLCIPAGSMAGALTVSPTENGLHVLSPPA